MKTLRADAPTLIVTRKWLFWKRYQLYVPLDGLYDVMHFTVAQQQAAIAAKKAAEGKTNGTTTN
jgi:hypothetical protein